MKNFQLPCLPKVLKIEEPISQFKNVLMIADLASVDRSIVERFEQICLNDNPNYHFILFVSNLQKVESIEFIYRKLFIDGIPDYSLQISFFLHENHKDVIANYTKENKIDLLVSFSKNTGSKLKKQVKWI